MATFKIHEDEDSGPTSFNFPKKDKKHLEMRCALGQIQNKKFNIGDPFKSNGPVINKDVASKGLALSTGFTENIKALVLNDNDKKKLVPTRSPLKDIRNARKLPETKCHIKPESPMSVDSSPHIQEIKENIKTIEIVDNHTPVQGIKKNIESKAILGDVSPMSTDVSPSPASSRFDSIKNSIHDLYGCYIYKKDIYSYLRKIEEKFRPKAYYMKRQPDIDYSMRRILVDWLVEVGEEYKLKNETLFMAVSYIDRFLSTMAVSKPKLQLLGTTAMFIASKFEEIYPPELGEFIFITDDSYTGKQFLRMERLILKVLNFDLSCPTAYTFLVHLSACVKLNFRIMYLAMYICELTLLEADPYLDFYPSRIACGAIALARGCLDYKDVWPCNIAQESGYSLHQLGSVITVLNETHRRSFTVSQTAIRQKYSAPEYDCVAKLPFKKLILRDTFSH